MMIKEIAEEIGVHPSTVSRAVSSKYAHTPQGVFELRYFFSEAVQGPSGGVAAAADPEAPRQKNDRRGGRRPSAYRRTHHGASASGRHSSDSPYRRKISRRYAHPVHSSKTGSGLAYKAAGDKIAYSTEPDGGFKMKITYRGIAHRLTRTITEKSQHKVREAIEAVGKKRRERGARGDYHGASSASR